MRNTASGMVFSDKQEKEEHKNKVTTAAQRLRLKEKADFTNICPSYCLSPEFYGSACLMPNGQVLLLTGLRNDYAVLKSFLWTTTELRYEDTLDAMLAQENQNLEEISEKVQMLTGDVSSPEAIALKKKTRVAIRDRMAQLQRAKAFCNTNFSEALMNMNLPPEAFRVGCKLGTNLYEFVSYRGDKARPYILENLETTYSARNHYKGVSFRMLTEGMLTYAEEELEGEAQENVFKMVDIMNPVDNVYEIETATEKEEKTEPKVAFYDLFAFV